MSETQAPPPDEVEDGGLRAIAASTAAEARGYLTAVTEVASGASPDTAIPVLLLAVSQALVTGARLGAITDVLPSERFEPDPGPDADVDPVRTGLANVLEGLDEYVDVVDPLTSGELVRGSLSDDLSDVAAALMHGLRHWRPAASTRPCGGGSSPTCPRGASGPPVRAARAAVRARAPAPGRGRRRRRRGRVRGPAPLSAVCTEDAGDASGDAGPAGEPVDRHASRRTATGEAERRRGSRMIVRPYGQIGLVSARVVGRSRVAVRRPALVDDVVRARPGPHGPRAGSASARRRPAPETAGSRRVTRARRRGVGHHDVGVGGQQPPGPLGVHALPDAGGLAHTRAGRSASLPAAGLGWSSTATVWVVDDQRHRQAEEDRREQAQPGDREVRQHGGPDVARHSAEKPSPMAHTASSSSEHDQGHEHPQRGRRRRGPAPTRRNGMLAARNASAARPRGEQLAEHDLGGRQQGDLQRRERAGVPVAVDRGRRSGSARPAGRGTARGTRRRRTCSGPLVGPSPAIAPPSAEIAPVSIVITPTTTNHTISAIFHRVERTRWRSSSTATVRTPCQGSGPGGRRGREVAPSAVGSRSTFDGSSPLLLEGQVGLLQHAAGGGERTPDAGVDRVPQQPRGAGVAGSSTSTPPGPRRRPTVGRVVGPPARRRSQVQPAP